MATIQERMMRAAKLDVALYEEVEADPTSMGQATAVVVMASVAAGIGGGGGASGLIVGTLAALISWYIWAYMTYFIGTRLLPEPQTSADHGELLRPTGFSAAHPEGADAAFGEREHGLAGVGQRHVTDRHIA